MSKTRTGKITRIEFDVSRNRSLLCHVWLEGTNINNMDESMCTFKALHYLVLKAVGDNVIFIEEGSYWNIQVPKEFIEAYNKDNSNILALKRSFNNFKNGMLKAKFGDSVEISSEEIHSIVDDFIKDELFARDAIIESCKSSDSKYAKQLVKEMGIKKTLQTMNPDDILSSLSARFMSKKLNNHKIVYSKSVKD